MFKSYDNTQLPALLQCKSIDTTCKNLGAYSHHSPGTIELSLGIGEAGVSIIPCWIMNAVPITSNALNGNFTIAHARPGAKRKSAALIYSFRTLCGAQQVSLPQAQVLDAGCSDPRNVLQRFAMLSVSTLLYVKESVSTCFVLHIISRSLHDKRMMPPIYSVLHVSRSLRYDISVPV